MSSKSKAKGSAFERACRDHAAARLGVRVERTVAGARLDRGDLAGLTWHGEPVVVECKDCKQQRPGEWMAETLRERDNARAAAGLLVTHRRGIGDARRGEEPCCMSRADFRKLAGLPPAQGGPEWVWLSYDAALELMDSRG